MTSACECIASIDAELAEQGLKLDAALCYSRASNSLDLRTYTPLLRKDNGKKETRRSKPSMMAHRFCPFCGLQHDALEAAAPAEGGAQ